MIRISVCNVARLAGTGGRVRILPVLIASSLWLGAAHGVPITIEVDLEADDFADVECTGLSIFCQAVVANESFPGSSLTFEIEDTDRAVNGAYDVAGSLGGDLIDALNANTVALGTTFSSYAATATTSGGLVTDLLLNIAYDAFSEGDTIGVSLVTANGSYTAATSTDIPDIGTLTVTFAGLFTITQPPAIEQPPTDPGPGPDPVTVPEPSTWVLLGPGLLILVGVLSRRARRMARAGAHAT
jgi:hypothetical protein